MSQSPSPALTFVPPRPNLGPEPWPESSPSPAWLLVIALALVGMVVLIGRILGRRSARSGTVRLPLGYPLPDTAEAEILILSDRARAVLVARFGGPYRARTTEEIGSDHDLIQSLGEQNMETLIALLSSSDRLKFAAEPHESPSNGVADRVAFWREWTVHLEQETAIAKATGKRASTLTPDRGLR